MKTQIPLLAVVAIALLPTVPLAGTITVREQSRLALDAGAITGVRVDNPRGLVEVRPSADGRIHVTALKLATASESSRAQEFARLTRVETATESGTFAVHVIYPQRRAIQVSLWRFFKGEFDFPGVEVRLAVEVPARLPVELRAASGDLRTSDLAGSQTLQTASGDIEVRGAGAPVSIATTSGSVAASGLARARVRSVSGDVTLDGLRGPLSLRTTSGDIEVNGAADSLDLGTVSGDITVEHAPRGIEAGTTSGDITVDGVAAGTVDLHSVSGEIHCGFDRGLRRADASTVSGDIQVRLGEGPGYALALSTTSGTIDSSVPLQIRTATRRQMSGSVRGGGAPVVLHSASGDIAVTGGGR